MGAPRSLYQADEGMEYEGLSVVALPQNERYSTSTIFFWSRRRSSGHHHKVGENKNSSIYLTED